MRLLFSVFFFFYASLSFAVCPVGFYDDGFGGCTNMDCPAGYTRPTIQDVCVLIPDTTPICTAPQYYDSLSNTCLTPQPCGAGYVPDPALPGSCTNFGCPLGEVMFNGSCATIPNCTGQQIYNFTTNTCNNNTSCPAPLVMTVDLQCVQPNTPGQPADPNNPNNSNPGVVFTGTGTFVTSLILDSIAKSLVRSEQDTHESSLALGDIDGKLTALSSQLSTSDNYQNSLLSDLVDKSLARDTNAKLDLIDTHLQAIANNTAKTCDPSVPVGYLGLNGLPGCAPSVSGSGVDNGLLQDIKDNTSELTSHGRGIDNALQEITGILSHAFPIPTEVCTPVLDAAGNPTFDSVGNPIEICTTSPGSGTVQTPTPSHGTASGSGLGTVSTPGTGSFDIASQQTVLSTKKTELQNKFQSIRDDIANDLSLSVSGSGDLPKYHLFDFRDHSIDVDFSMYAAAFSIIGNVIFLLAVLLSLHIILGP